MPSDSSVLQQLPVRLVDLAAGIGVFATSFPLYTVLIVYAIDAFVGTVRYAATAGFAAPRTMFTPPSRTESRDTPGIFRLLGPKIGSLSLPGPFPPATLRNLGAAAAGVVFHAGLVLPVFGVFTLVVLVPTPGFEAFVAWPVTGVVAAGVAVSLLEHGVSVARYLRSDRPELEALQSADWSDGRTYRFAFLFLVPFPVAFVNFLHGQGAAASDAMATLGTPLAVVVIVGRVVGSRVTDSLPTGADDPVELAAPDGLPRDRIRPSSRAIRAVGLLDGLVGRVGCETGTDGTPPAWVLWIRAVFLRGLFVVVLPPALLFMSVSSPVVPVGLFDVVWLLPVAATVVLGVVGVAQFELAFGAVEYRLYDEELVAYDTRLDAVQWRAPLAEIHDVSVADGWWLSPPGTDVGTVRLDRSGMETTARPYGFVRQSLVCVADPERVADRLRRVTVEKTRQVERSDDVCGMPSQQ